MDFTNGVNYTNGRTINVAVGPTTLLLVTLNFSLACHGLIILSNRYRLETLERRRFMIVIRNCVVARCYILTVVTLKEASRKQIKFTSCKIRREMRNENSTSLCLCQQSFLECAMKYRAIDGYLLTQYECLTYALGIYYRHPACCYCKYEKKMNLSKVFSLTLAPHPFYGRLKRCVRHFTFSVSMFVFFFYI